MNASKKLELINTIINDGCCNLDAAVRLLEALEEDARAEEIKAKPDNEPFCVDIEPHCLCNTCVHDKENLINACCSRMTAHCPTESCKDYEHYAVLYNE